MGERGRSTSGAVGWLNVKMFEETGDEVKSQGWTPFILDTNGNGKRDEYAEPNQPRRSQQGQAHQRGVLRRCSEPDDGTVWGSVLGFPGYVVRLDPGPAQSVRRPRSRKCYELPVPGYGPRGMDIDRSGVVWIPLASGHMASFDRRKCKGPLNGPNRDWPALS